MKTIMLNTLNDIFIGGDGRLAMLSNVDAIQQNCITAMQALRGEMRYAQDKGMPYQQTVWNNYNPGAFEAAARATLLAVPGVTQILLFLITRDGDNLNYQASINTIYGTVNVNSL